MIRLRLTVVSAGSARDVVVEADPAAPVSDVCVGLGLDAATAMPGIDPGTPVVESGLVSGVVVGQNVGAFPDWTTGLGAGERLRERWRGLARRHGGQASGRGQGFVAATGEVSPLQSRLNGTLAGVSRDAGLPDLSVSACGSGFSGGGFEMSVHGVGTVTRASGAAGSVVGIDIVSGVFAGISVPVWGEVMVGRSPRCDVCIPDPSVEPFHLQLVVGERGLELTPVGAAHVLVDGELVDAPVRVGVDSIVQVGGSLIRPWVDDGLESGDVVLEPGGGVGFNRGSRVRARVVPEVVVMPGNLPEDVSKSPLPWIAMIAPVIMGGAMYLLTHSPFSLLLMVMSPVMVIGNQVQSRRTAKKRGGDARSKWVAAVRSARGQVQKSQGVQRSREWMERVDAARLLRVVESAAVGLWERRISDSDAWLVRVGVGELELDVKVEGTLPPEVKARGGSGFGVSPVPVGVDLAAGVVGVAGVGHIRAGLLRWMVGQVVALRSPRDVGVVVLCSDGAGDVWSWVRWVPHVVASAVGAGGVGNTAQSRAARVKELAGLVGARLAAVKAEPRVVFESQVLVVVDGARSMRDLPGMVQVLRDGPGVGVFVLAADEDRSRLPEECVAEVVIGDVGGRGHGSEMRTDMGVITTADRSSGLVLLEGVSAEWCERVGRALAPLVHVGGVGDESLVPSAVRLIDVLGSAERVDDPGWVVRRWAGSAGGVGSSLSAVVGVDGDGGFVIDLVADGPHGLVAGTTGAGKSEFLQTLIASLAVSYRPDELGFVLIDYKGGSAFGACESLPHVVGMVTNLDGRGTVRALESLKAELTRRERLFGVLGVKDVGDAWLKDAAWCRANSVGRLVIVVDEFAELKAELPDFVSELVRIARVGRSLGVHLVLATQRPSGAISAEMQSNTNLRVALRVTDKSDSTDVLGSGEAALIPSSLPGRGYVRRGLGQTPAVFQCARVGGRRRDAHQEEGTVVRVADGGWAGVGSAPVFPPEAPRSLGKVDVDNTDLRAVVGAVLAASEAQGCGGMVSPWLPELPEQVSVEQAVEAARDGGQLPQPSGDVVSAGGVEFGLERVVVGIEDVPTEQAQRGLMWDPCGGEHVAFVGSPRCGRSTVLRTIGAQIVAGYNPAKVHLYCFDFGSGALLPFSKAPHCGAVVLGAQQVKRAEALLELLVEEIARRQQVLMAGGFGDIGEQRASTQGADRLPYMVVLLDRWEDFVASWDSDDLLEMRERMLKLARSGPAVGLSIAVTSDRTLSYDKLLAVVPHAFAMRMMDDGDYAQYGVKKKEVPTHVPDGRLFGGDPVSEVQVAVVGEDSGGQAQAERVGEVVAAALRAYGVPGVGPIRVDPMPELVSIDQVLERSPGEKGSALCVVPGVDGAELNCVRVGLDFTAGFMVLGARRSGRSNAIAAMALEAHRRSLGVCVLAARNPALVSFLSARGITVIGGVDDRCALQMDHFLEEQQGPGVVFIDDMLSVNNSVLDAGLLRRWREHPVGSLGVVGSMTFDESQQLLGPLLLEVRNCQQGMGLWPQSAMQGNRLGGVMPRAFLGKSVPGRGVLMVNGEASWVQVPWTGYSE